ncbi:MAG: PilZ domain-containing protein [Candidatus Omnitrophota bacterium]
MSSNLTAPTIKCMENWNNKERRRYIRITKHFIISYFDRNDPAVKHDVSQVRNISLGGICFITSVQYAPSTKLAIELKTPYLSDTAHMEGTVLESSEKITGMIYETRLVFSPLAPQVEIILKRVIETFLKMKEEKNSNE